MSRRLLPPQGWPKSRSKTGGGLNGRSERLARHSFRHPSNITAMAINVDILAGRTPWNEQT
jgi:hypothetical protein